MNNYQFFENKQCEYYPCHKFQPINCLFCYCPLYYLKDCGGNYQTLKSGIKDCSNCQLPHTEKGYDYIVNKIICSPPATNFMEGSNE